MPRKDHVTLKAFWEAVEHRLAACSADELRIILRAMARQTLPTERQAFLDSLHAVEETADAAQQAIRQESLLADIDDLARELQAEAKRADSREERDGYEYRDDDDDEDHLGPYEEFVEPLTALFERVEAVFDHGNLPLACAAYEKLFTLCECEDDYGRGVNVNHLESVDVGEARARYLRAVYETTPLPRRPKILAERMQQAQSWVGGSLPMLDDLVQVSPKPLSDREQFFADWIAFLRQRTDREADAWLREALRLSQGTQGLEALARTEGNKRPRAYLDWLAALEREGKRREILAAGMGAADNVSLSSASRRHRRSRVCGRRAPARHPRPALRAMGGVRRQADPCPPS